jgi:hypothetical protein
MHGSHGMVASFGNISSAFDVPGRNRIPTSADASSLLSSTYDSPEWLIVSLDSLLASSTMGAALVNPTLIDALSVSVLDYRTFSLFFTRRI